MSKATPALVSTGPIADLAVGDLVVYGFHGIGRVSARRAAAANGGRDETIVLELSQGLSVTLPMERAVETLRPLASARDLTEVQRTLCDPETADASSWHKRFKATREKLALGEVVGLAEVVRDGVLRERRSAGRGAVLSPTERHLYLRARQLLAEEIGILRGLESADADAWIVEQVPQPAAAS